MGHTGCGVGAVLYGAVGGPAWGSPRPWGGNGQPELGGSQACGCGGAGGSPPTNSAVIPWFCSL